jgi:putative ABC transport system ATP-binding protein
VIGQTLEVQNLHKTYDGAERPVFDGFSLEVAAGCLCAVVGVSGVGKTTLLNCVAGLDHWEGGEIRLGGTPLAAGDKHALALYRRNLVGLAFQHPHLLPEFTVMENLLMPLRLDREPVEADQDWVRDLLRTVGLEGLEGRFPNQLSVGQGARVGLIRALVRKPALWLLDEPTGNLDPATTEEVFGVLLRLQAELGPTTLLVTHNHHLAERCERIVRLG